MSSLRENPEAEEKEADPGQQQKSGAAKPTYATDSKRKKADGSSLQKQQRFFGMVRKHPERGNGKIPHPRLSKLLPPPHVLMQRNLQVQSTRDYQ